MMKQNVFLLAACLFLTSILFAGFALASTTCKVVSVQGTQITLDCGDKSADYSVGMKVKIKAKKARKAMEGC